MTRLGPPHLLWLPEVPSFRSSAQEGDEPLQRGSLCQPDATGGPSVHIQTLYAFLLASAHTRLSCLWPPGLQLQFLIDSALGPYAGSLGPSPPPTLWADSRTPLLSVCPAENQIQFSLPGERPLWFLRLKYSLQNLGFERAVHKPKSRYWSTERSDGTPA